MKIRTKLALLSTSMLALYGLGLMSLLAHLVCTRFLTVEKGIARQDIDRISQALQRETESLGVLTEDWARWDDLWHYTQGRNSTFERVNLQQETFTNANLSFIAIYDAKGERRYGKEYHPQKGLVECWFFPYKTSPDGPPEFRTVASGIIQTPSGLMLAYCSTILRSDHSGPSMGFIVMGRHLDQTMLDSISLRTNVPFTHTTPGRATPEIPLEVSIDSGGSIREDPDGHRLYGFHPLRTTTGTTVLIVRTTTERIIAQASHSVMISIAIQSSLIALFLWAVTWHSFRRWVTRPLCQIENALLTLDLNDEAVESDQAIQKLPAFKNELGQVVRVLQELYERMRFSHRQAKHLNETLESEVAARTEALIKAHQRLTLFGKILENTSEGLLITDLDGTILEVNDAMCKQSGYAREELIGQNPRILKSFRHNEEFYQQLWSALLTTGHWSGEIWDRRRGGEDYPKWLTINTIPNPKGQPSHYVGLSIDISAIKMAEERLHHMAYYDQLTGLPNRALFIDRLRRTLIRTQRKQVQSALLFLDLDRFKNINDTLGHSMGDALLIRVAERLRERLRESDTVCRMGGDEFTVILSEVAHPEDAGQVAAELIASLTKPFTIDGSEIYVGVSIGISLCPRDGLDEETLVKKADTAMYAAKDGGRSTFRFSSGELDAASRKRMEIEAKLRGAVERHEMVLHFQPLVRTAAAAEGSPAGLVGAEALIRWVPEPGVILGPGTFIGIAEDSGLIGTIGEWAIREACRIVKGWCEIGLNLSVSVNVSARQFENDHLPAIVRSALEESGLPPSLLRLEITESAFVRNMDKVVGIMDELRQIGVRFSIDDFGTGFSSLQYIKVLPVQCLKIDKLFVSGVAANLSDAEIVSAIIAMSRAFGLKSIAEGVETEDQLRELRERGCDEVQGYLVAKPMPDAEFQAFARRLQ